MYKEQFEEVQLNPDQVPEFPLDFYAPEVKRPYRSCVLAEDDTVV